MTTTPNLALVEAELGDLVGADVLTVLASNFSSIDAMFAPGSTNALSIDVAVANPTNNPVISGSFTANQPTAIIEVDSAWTSTGVAKFVPTLWVGPNISPPLPGTAGVTAYPLPPIGGGASAGRCSGRRVITGLTVGETVNYQITLRALIGTTHLLSTDSISEGLTPPISLTGPIAISSDNLTLYLAGATKVFALTTGRDVINNRTVVRTSVTFSAAALTYSPSGFLYAISTTTNPGVVTNSISLLAVSNLATLNTLSPASGVWNLVDAAVSPDGTLLYTADGTTGIIQKYSGASISGTPPTPVSNVTLPSPYVPSSMAISPNGAILAVAAGAAGHNSTVYFISTSSMSVSESYSVGAAVAVPRPSWESNSTAAWVASYGHPGQVVRVLAATGLVDGSAGTIFSPAITGIAVGTANEALYVVGNSGTSGDAQWSVFGIPLGTTYSSLSRTDGARMSLAVSTDGFVYSVLGAADMDTVLGGSATCGASSGTTLLTGDYFTVNVYGGS